MSNGELDEVFRHTSSVTECTMAMIIAELHELMFSKNAKIADSLNKKGTFYIIILLIPSKFCLHLFLHQSRDIVRLDGRFLH